MNEYLYEITNDLVLTGEMSEQEQISLLKKKKKQDSENPD